MSEFKVGDRVEDCVGASSAFGRHGTVIMVEDTRYRVKFDGLDGAYFMRGKWLRGVEKGSSAMTEAEWADLLRRVEALEDGAHGHKADALTIAELNAMHAQVVRDERMMSKGLYEACEKLEKERNRLADLVQVWQRLHAGVNKDKLDAWEKLSAAQVEVARLERELADASDINYRAMYNQAQDQLAAVTEDCAGWKEKWKEKWGEKWKILIDLRNAKEEIKRLEKAKCDLEAQVEALQTNCDGWLGAYNAVHDELTSAKEAMNEQEAEIQRACGLLRSALVGSKSKFSWVEEAEAFLVVCNAGPSYAKG